MLLAVRQRKRADDLLPLDVPNPHVPKLLETRIVEDRRIDRTRPERLVPQLCVRVIALRQHGKEMPHTVIEEVTVATLVRDEANLFEVPERLKAITALVNLVPGRQNVQLGTALREENEEQPVDDHEAVVLHLRLEGIVRLIVPCIAVRIELALAEGTVRHLAHVVKRLIGKRFHR